MTRIQGDPSTTSTEQRSKQETAPTTKVTDHSYLPSHLVNAAVAVVVVFTSYGLSPTTLLVFSK